jgi:sec-independent protein translocase protein TatC
MASKLKPVGHDERLSLVEHLDELRTRIIICVAAFAVAFGFCLWQDDAVLDIINRPLEKTAFSSCDTTKDPFEQANCWQQAMRRVNTDLAALADEAARQASTEPRLERLAERLARSASASRSPPPYGWRRTPRC